MSTNDELILEVAARAIVVNPEGKILILREADEKGYAEGTNSGRYHGAVGGRIKPEETYEQGLRREVEEEVGITDLTVVQTVHADDWWPVIHGVTHHIVGIYSVCKTNTTAVQLSNEHDQYQWISPSDRGNYDIFAADLHAIEAYIALAS